MRNSERGLTLIELMVAISILAVGMGALLSLFLSATVSNKRNQKDTASTLLAQMVLDQIAAQNPNSVTPIILSDCQGTAWTVATAGGAPNTGTGASINPNTGLIDQTQAYAAIPAGYGMQYQDCGVGGQTGTYEVRWNVITLIANQSRLITVSARQANLSSNQLGTTQWSIPVTLRGIGAN
jgi:prepilin-type N-terminal cleavage/methylation domain-containing protein